MIHFHDHDVVALSLSTTPDLQDHNFHLGMSCHIYTLDNLRVQSHAHACIFWLVTRGTYISETTADTPRIKDLCDGVARYTT